MESSLSPGKPSDDIQKVREAVAKAMGSAHSDGDKPGEVSFDLERSATPSALQGFMGYRGLVSPVTGSGSLAAVPQRSPSER